MRVYTDRDFGIRKRDVHRLVAAMKRDLGFELRSLEIDLAERARILDINKKFLNHNYATDVISFDYSEDGETLDGEVICSPEVAEENAERFGVERPAEVARVIVHGVLHLLGYDDQTAAERARMKAIEDKLVEAYADLLE
ncbi:MAG: rRNA maturation RNase YbeY [Ignavibacteriales bacterium]|nr:rRNA maturation RNase YbeY [Ignavibacteriales bacterium]